jgi:hypothetical protein
MGYVWVILLCDTVAISLGRERPFHAFSFYIVFDKGFLQKSAENSWKIQILY